MITGDWTGTDLGGTNGYIIMTQATSVVESPAFSTVGQTNLTVDFWARTYGGTSSSNITVSISTNNGSSWNVLAVASPSNGSSWVSMPTVSDAANLGHAQTRIRWQSLDASGTVGVGVRTLLLVQGWSPGTAPFYVAGWSNAAKGRHQPGRDGPAGANDLLFPRAGGEYVRQQRDSRRQRHDDGAAAGGPDHRFPGDSRAGGDEYAELSATASSGLPVSFAVASGPAVLAGGTTLTFTGAGSVSIVASQAGNADWNPAPDVTNLLTVSKALASVALGNLTQDYDGTPKGATATTEPAGLAVEFTYDGEPTAPTAAGSYAVTGTVNDAVYQGSATGTLLIAESLTPFQLWVRDEQGQSLSDSNFVESADYDGDGATTEEEYLADTDPASADSVLGLTGTYVNKAQAGGETGEMRFTFPASSARSYQLIYSADLSATLTNNLGWGVPDMVVTNNFTGTWFGTIRAFLDNPAE